MRRGLFTEDHEAFRELAREFVEKEIGPHYADWEKAGHMPRETYEKLGGAGHDGHGHPRGIRRIRPARLSL
jgi:acyl-CoA dehydrogenase